MMNVYIVTHGEYSDYGISAVFDNEEAAGNYAESTNGRVEIYELNSVSPIPQGMHIYYLWYYEGSGWGAVTTEDLDEVGESSSGKSNPYGYSFKTHCFAKSEQHALKIASERKAFMIATYGTEAYSTHRF
jgi:hypothetical protein